MRIFGEISVVELNRVPVLANKHLSQISSEIKPKELSNSTILDVCSTLKAFQTNWQTLDVEESIELSWNQKYPSKSVNVNY